MPRRDVQPGRTHAAGTARCGPARTRALETTLEEGRAVAPHAEETARRTLALAHPFRFFRGGSLPAITLAYETWGPRASAPSLLILTGLSPSAHAASSDEDPAPGWWEPLIGPGRAIDTRRIRVFCFNSLGSCFGSSGPAAINPVTGHPYGTSFPELAIEDIAEAAYQALRALGVERLDAVIGPSMGGFSALALALLHPGFVRRLGLLCTASTSEPFAIAIRSLQREVLASHRHGDPEAMERGMMLARKLGLISYRSAVEWRERFGRRRETDPRSGAAHAFDVEAPFAVEWYLEQRARSFARHFDPDAYFYLSRAMDQFDAEAHGGGRLDQALSRLQLEQALVAGVVTDQLYPPHQQESLAQALGRAGIPVDLRIFDSPFGHDSFLIDWEHFAPPIRKLLEFA
ncbi:MAG: homoserine O-acetyltransferase family protein [Gammaproteobacteria bacterium]